jgi:hypothetical protein
LAATPFYSIDEIRPLEGDELTIGYRCDGRPLGGGCFVLVVLEGAVELRSIERSFEPMLLELGRTVLVPAAVALGSQLVIRERGVRVLRVTVGPA